MKIEASIFKTRRGGLTDYLTSCTTTQLHPASRSVLLSTETLQLKGGRLHPYLPSVAMQESMLPLLSMVRHSTRQWNTERAGSSPRLLRRSLMASPPFVHQPTRTTTYHTDNRKLRSLQLTRARHRQRKHLRWRGDYVHRRTRRRPGQVKQSSRSICSGERRRSYNHLG